MPRFFIAATCIFASLATAHIGAQSTVPVQVPSGWPVRNLPKTPPTFTLIPQGPGAHPGKVWARSADDGLHIYGEVEVPESSLHWPAEKSELLATDHVEIWLGAVTDVPMPPIGWGNQFGENKLGSIKDCASWAAEEHPKNAQAEAECENWYKLQVEYRAQLQRLFTRQWLVATIGYKSYAFEDFATSAWHTLESDFIPSELPMDLQPKSAPGVGTEISELHGRQITKYDAAGNPRQEGVPTGYTFAVLIPYAQFPPVQQLDLKDLRLMVDVFSPAPAGKKTGPFSTTSAQRVWGKPSSFNPIRIEQSRVHQIAPCRFDAVEQDIYGNASPVLYFPLAGSGPLYLHNVLTLENQASGYLYDPARVSPIVVNAEKVWKDLPSGATVCGPTLTWTKGETIKPSKFNVEPKYFETKTLPDGWTLVRTGPDMSTQSPFGSGACGACPVMDFHIYAVSPAGDIAPALDISEEYSGMGDNPLNGDLAIADDWGKISHFTESEPAENAPPNTPTHWTREDFCLAGHTYKPCGGEQGSREKVKAPDPPNFKMGDED